MHGQDGHCLPFQNEKRGFAKMIFSSRFKTPDEIARRVMGVWELPITMYFNLCPFFLNTTNCKSPSGYQTIFISKNGEFSFVAI